MEVKVIVETGADKKRRFQRQVSIQDNPLESRDDEELPPNKYGDRFSIKPASQRASLDSRPFYQHFQHFHRQQPHEPYKCSCFTKTCRAGMLELERANCLASYRRPIGDLYAGHRLPKRSKSADPTLSRAQQFTFGSKKQLKSQLENDFSWTLVVCVLLVRLIIVGPPLNFNLLYVEFRGLFLYHPYTEIIGCLNRISGHISSPFLMAIVLRYKALRLITFLGCVTCSLSLIFTAFSFEFHQIVLTFSILNGVCGELVQICSTLVVIQHYRQKLWLVEVFSLLSNGLAYTLFSLLIYSISSWLSWRAALRMASGLTYLTLISVVYFRSSPGHRSGACRSAPLLAKKLERKKEKQLKQFKLLKPSFNRPKQTKKQPKKPKQSPRKLERQFTEDEEITVAKRKAVIARRTADRDGSVSSAISGLNSSSSGPNSSGHNSNGTNSNGTNSSGPNSNGTNSTPNSNATSRPNNSRNDGSNATVPNSGNSGNSSDTKTTTESSNRHSEARTMSTTLNSITTSSHLTSGSLTSANTDTDVVCIDIPDEESSDHCRQSKSFSSLLFRRQSSEQSDRRLEERLERALSNKAIPKRALPIRALSTRRTLLARRTLTNGRTLPARRTLSVRARPERWSLKRLLDCLKRKQYSLNNLFRRLIRSAYLIEYLRLLKSRDLRLIIIFYFLGSLGQIYLAIVEQVQDEHCLANELHLKLRPGDGYEPSGLDASGGLRTRLLTNHKLFKSKKIHTNVQASRAHFSTVLYPALQSTTGEPTSTKTDSDANLSSLSGSKSRPPSQLQSQPNQPPNQRQSQSPSKLPSKLPSQLATPSTDRRTVRLINAINLVNLPRVNIDETCILDLLLLNVLFGVGYCCSLAATSFLLSRLYLTSKHACKLAILGALLSVLTINLLNTCWLRSGLAAWPSTMASVALNDFGCELKSLNNLSSLNSVERSSGIHSGVYDGVPTEPTEPTAHSRQYDDTSRTLSCTLVHQATSLPIGLLRVLSENVYITQTALYLLYGFFQAQLEYSTRLLLIERFSQEKLLRVISLQRFLVGLGHLSLLFVRIIVKRLNASQTFGRLSSICESDDCRILLSSLIVACSSSAAIVLIRFVSNRSVKPARSRSASIRSTGKVVKAGGWLPSALLRPFRAFKALKLFRKQSDSVHRATSARRSMTTNPLKKQLSDSDLKALEILRDLAIQRNLASQRVVASQKDLVSQRDLFGHRDLVTQRNLANFNDKHSSPVHRLRRTKSDQQLTKANETFDSDHPSNYLVDCVQCGRYFVVDIDPNKVNLIEICLLDDMKVSLVLENQ